MAKKGKPARSAANDGYGAKADREIARLQKELAAARDANAAGSEQLRKNYDACIAARAEAGREKEAAETARADRDRALEDLKVARDDYEALRKNYNGLDQTLAFAEADLAFARESILDLTRRLTATTSELRELRRDQAEQVARSEEIKPQCGVFAGPNAD